MMKIRTRCILLAVCTCLLAHADYTGITVTEGDPVREYSRLALPLTYVMLDVRTRAVGQQNLPFYSNPRVCNVTHPVFRVHVPLTVVVRQGARSDNATIAYAFGAGSGAASPSSPTSPKNPRASRNSSGFGSPTRPTESTAQPARGPRGSRRAPVPTGIKWADLPLAAGINEWTLTSDWMVGCDPRFADKDNGFMVEKQGGGLAVVDKPGKDDRVIGKLSTMLFPFDADYWSLNPGLAGKWIESLFPNFVMRSVSGNEDYQGVSYMIFTDDENCPGVGNMNAGMMNGLVQQALANWTDPYAPAPTYTNTWEAQSWATNFGTVSNQALQGAYLAHAVRKNENDLDANDLLLRNLVGRGDKELASRAYSRTSRAFPELSEYWLQQYVGVLGDQAELRAVLASYRREHPDSIIALKMLAESYVQERQWRLARRLAERWVELQPSNVHAHAILVKCAQGDGLEETAQAEMARIVRFGYPADPTLTGFYGRGTAAYHQYLLAESALNSSNYERGAMLLRSCALKNPTYYPAMLRAGRFYAETDVPTMAREYFGEALAVAPTHPLALSGLANVFASVDNKTLVRTYQELLWQVLQPMIEEEALNRNWTGVVTLTQCVLSGSPAHGEAVKLQVQAYMRLGLYDKASSVLYQYSEKLRRDTDVIALWADLGRLIGADQRVIVLEPEPVRWNERARAAWADLVAIAPTPRAHLEIALLHLADGDLYKAYLALRDLYRMERSPEIALWIADLCMQKAEEKPSLTMPNRGNITYTDEAQSWYRKALASSGPSGSIQDLSRPLFSPAAYLGLVRAALLKDPQSQEPAALMRECFRHFPGSLDARAASIWRSTMTAGGPPTALWAPYTNAYDSMMPLHWNIASVMAEIARARGDKVAGVRALLASAASQLQWCKLFYGKNSTKEELEQPYRYYTFEKDSGYRFVLKRHTFVRPAEAGLWFAMRSRFSMEDLRDGTTRWWKRQGVLRLTQNIVAEAAQLQRYAGSNTFFIPASWINGISLFDAAAYPVSPSAAYAGELQRYFYAGTSGGGGGGHSPDLKGLPEVVSPQPDGIQGSPLPYVVRSRSWIAPPLRHLYIPAMAAQWLHPLDRDRALQPLVDDKWFTTATNRFIWPDIDRGMRIWSTAGGGGMARDMREDSVDIPVPAAPSVTASWDAVGGVPLLRATLAPQFPSPFTTPLSGTVVNPRVVQSASDASSPSRLWLVLTPAPMKRSVCVWPDEAVVIECLLSGGTNMGLRAYARSYSAENGIMLGKPGMALGANTVAGVSSVWWRVDANTVSVGINTNAPSISAAHGLSPFAWTQGMYFSLEAPMAQQAATIRFSSLRVTAASP